MEGIDGAVVGRGDLSAKEWIDKGIRLVPFSNEITLLLSAGASAITEIRTYAQE